MIAILLIGKATLVCAGAAAVAGVVAAGVGDGLGPAGGGVPGRCWATAETANAARSKIGKSFLIMTFVARASEMRPLSTQVYRALHRAYGCDGAGAAGVTTAVAGFFALNSLMKEIGRAHV